MVAFINRSVPFNGKYISGSFSNPPICGSFPTPVCPYPPSNSKFTVTDNLWFTPQFPGNIKIDLLNVNYSPTLIRWASQQYAITNTTIINNNGNAIGTWFLDIHPGNYQCPIQLYLLIQGAGWPIGSQIQPSNNVVWMNNVTVCYNKPTITVTQLPGGFYTWGNFTLSITPFAPFPPQIPVFGVLI